MAVDFILELDNWLAILESENTSGSSTCKQSFEPETNMQCGRSCCKAISHLPPCLPGRLSRDSSSLPPGFWQGARLSVSLPLRVQQQAVTLLLCSRAQALQQQDVPAFMSPYCSGALLFWCCPVEQETQRAGTLAFAMWVINNLNQIRGHCFFTSWIYQPFLTTPMLSQSLFPGQGVHWSTGTLRHVFPWTNWEWGLIPHRNSNSPFLYVKTGSQQHQSAMTTMRLQNKPPRSRWLKITTVYSYTCGLAGTAGLFRESVRLCHSPWTQAPARHVISWKIQRHKERKHAPLASTFQAPASIPPTSIPLANWVMW